MENNENNNCSNSSSSRTPVDDETPGNGQETVNTRRTSSHARTAGENTRTRSRRASVSVCSRVRKIVRCDNSQEKLAKGCCTCGIVCIAAGGGLILVYVMGVYTNFFGEVSNLSALSVPGFCFFFIGLIAAVFGIIFCWGCPNRRSRGRRGGVSDRDLNEAGFGLPGIDDSNGYFNRGLVLDPPPAYSDILSTSTSNSAVCAVRMDDISVPSMEGTSQHHQQPHHPPAYLDAVKVKWRLEEKEREEEASIRVETDDIAPPAYAERDSEVSEHEC